MRLEHRTRVGTAVLAVVGMLAGGCAGTVAGVGSYAKPAAVSHVDTSFVHGSENSTSDRYAADAVTDVQTYWTAQMPAVFGKPYKPVSGVYSVDPNGSVTAPCTSRPADIRGNAFYCPPRDIVAWDREGLLPSLQQKFGPFLIAMVLAHEWGHVIQKRTSYPGNGRTIVVETQADCYAGAWTANAQKGGAPHFPIDRSDLDKALAGYLLFRDPVGSSANDRQAHGSGFDRISAFQEGYEQGPKHCTGFDTNRTFTENGFGNQQDQANNGNLSFQDTITQGPKDVAAFWSSSFQRIYGKPWKDLAALKSFTADSRPKCDGQDVSEVQYCAADDTVYYNADALRTVYDKTQGDFGPISLFAVAYGLGVRKRLDKSIDPDSQTALLGSICLAGGYARDSFSQTATNRLRLSPGDLDEAIRALLDVAGRGGFFTSKQTTGFDRVSAFRQGFSDVAKCT